MSQMDPNDDNSLFTFINNLTSIPLQEKDDTGGEQALAFAMNSSEHQIITSGANLAVPNTLSFHTSASDHHNHLLLKKKFKGLSISGDSSDGLGSTGASEKSSSEGGGCGSTNSDGSSNCSVSDQHHQQAAAHVESILSPLIGCGGLIAQVNSLSTAVPHPPPPARESSESPASSHHSHSHNHLNHNNFHSLHHFFGFQNSANNSNSSSPPLSQAAFGNSSASSSASSGVLSEGVSRNGLNSSGGGLSTSSAAAAGIDNTFTFNNLASKMAFNSVQLPASKNNENSFCSTSNPLDSMFSSFLNGSGSSTFLSSENHRRNFASPQLTNTANGFNSSSSNSSSSFPLLPTNSFNSATSTASTSQDNSPAVSQLPHTSFFPNNSNNNGNLASAASSASSSYSPFSGNGKSSMIVEGGGVDCFLNPGLQQRKAFSSLFNGGGNSVTTNHHSNALSDSTSPIISSGGSLESSTPQMLSSSTTNIFESSNNSGTPFLHNQNHHHQNQMMSGNGHFIQQHQPNNGQQLQLMNSGNSSNVSIANMQARFESHIRTLASEINATVQLYTSSIEIRKEQLIKQLDHVKSTYLLLLKQQQSSNSKPTITFPRIQFARPDPSHLKVATSFGYLNSPAFAPYCHASGEGLSVAIEGEPACFVVATRNCFNEEMLTGGEAVEVEIQAIETSVQHHQQHHNQHHQHQNGYHSTTSSIIQRSILDNHNGKYSVSYILPRGGNLRSVKIQITVNGLPVTSSPFLATVKVERVRECWRRVALFGEEGTAAGKFCRPWGVAMARLPLVREPSHKAVGGETVTSTPVQSKPFFSWSVAAHQEHQTKKRDYVLAVADRSNNRIQLLKLSIGIEGGGSGKGMPTEGMFQNGGLRSSLENIIGSGGVDISVMHVFGSGPGTRNGQFDRPAGIAINGNLGQIVVVDKDNHRIQSFDMAGNFLFKFGEKGSRAGQFCYPWDVAICPQTSMVLVSDTRNRRIQLFTHFGQYLWHCGQPLDSPRGVAFLSPERYIVSDFNKHRLLIIDRNEGGGNGLNSAGMLNGQSILTTLGSPSSAFSDSNGSGLTSGINSKYIGFGEGSAWGEFLRPQGLAVSKTSLGGSNLGGLPNLHHQQNHGHHNLHHLHQHQQQQHYRNTQIICSDSRNSRIAIWSSLNQSFEYICEESNSSSSNSPSVSSKSSEHNQQQHHSYPPGLMLNAHSNSINTTSNNSFSSSSSTTATTTTSSTAFDRPSGLAMADDILAVVDFGNNRLQIFQRSVTTAN